ncbi:MAG: hypothetical protein RL616_142 [Verrucomicrobiota bacterium]|jgi:glycosyltransferase involved in cell wall biosynthesis
MERPLAIIILAYKTKYFREALESIAAQTDQRFQLYIFDDASPEPVEKIVREFEARICLRYHRFSENLGGKSLVQHAQRCLNKTSEPWLWLFADDDMMAPGCVKAFHSTLAETKAQHDGYRFNALKLNSSRRFLGTDSERLEARPLQPEVQRGRDFLEAQFSQHNCCLQSLVFSRAAWLQKGMQDFPLGHHIDDAFLASMGEPKPLRTIAGPKVIWRLSDENISGIYNPANDRLKILAGSLFVNWAHGFLCEHGMSRQQAAVITEHLFYEQFRWLSRFINLEYLRESARLSERLWQRSPGDLLIRALEHNLSLLVDRIGRAACRLVLKNTHAEEKDSGWQMWEQQIKPRLRLDEVFQKSRQ